MAQSDSVWRSVEEKLDAIRRAKETTERGDSALRILRQPEIEGFFKTRLRDTIDVLLNPALCPDSELPRWRASAAALIDLYSSLTAAVAAGDVAGKRLAELDNQGKKKEE